MFVIDGKTVHLPQSGAAPAVVVNRSSLPATAAERTDTTSDYNLDSFTSNPTVIRDVDSIEVSYDKRMSVLNDHIGQINSSIADYIATLWAPAAAARIVRTSGANRGAMSTGATGNRKLVTVADFIAAKRILDKDNAPTEGRFVLLPSEMYNDLLGIGDVLTSEKMGSANLASGAVGRLLGFDIYIRSTALTFTNDTTPVVKLPGAATATTDNAAALFWQKDFVRRALGEVKIFANENDPQYYGSIFSAEVRAGGKRGRTDEKGVVVLVESAGV